MSRAPWIFVGSFLLASMAKADADHSADVSNRRARWEAPSIAQYQKDELDIEEEAENLLRAAGIKLALTLSGTTLEPLNDVFGNPKVVREVKILREKSKNREEITEKELDKLNEFVRELFGKYKKSRVALENKKHNFFKRVVGPLDGNKAFDFEMEPYSVKIAGQTLTVTPHAAQAYPGEIWSTIEIDRKVKVSPKEFLSKAALKRSKQKKIELGDPTEVEVRMIVELDPPMRFAVSPNHDSLVKALAPLGKLERKLPEIKLYSWDLRRQ